MDSEEPARHEPVRASLTRRTFGWLIDYAIVMVPAVVVVGLALVRLVQGLPAYVGAVAGEVGWSHLVRLVTRGSAGGGLGAVAGTEWIAFATPLIGALLLVPLTQFGYQSVMLSWRGWTIGKMLTDTRLATSALSAARPTRGPAVRRAFIVTLLDTGLVTIALVVITLGEFFAGIVLWAIAVLAFWLNALTILGPRRRTFVDRLAGTVVIRTALYAEGFKHAAALGRRTSTAAGVTGRWIADVAASAGRTTSTAAITAGQNTIDAATRAGQRTRESAETLTHSAAAQQARQWGTAGAERASVVGGRAADQAQRLGGRARQTWRRGLTEPRQTPEPTDQLQNPKTPPRDGP